MEMIPQGYTSQHKQEHLDAEGVTSHASHCRDKAVAAQGKKYEEVGQVSQEENQSPAPSDDAKMRFYSYR